MPDFAPLDIERLMQDLAAAPTRCEVRDVLTRFYAQDGALTEEQTEHVAGIIQEKPDE
jgi:hypothetical protein